MRRILFSFAFVLLAFSTAGFAQRTEPGVPPPLNRWWKLDQYRAQVADLLPAYDDGLLLPAVGPDWISSVSVAQIAAAVQDSPPTQIVRDGSRVEARDPQETKVIKIDLDRGRVRYLNNTRTFDWATFPHTAVAESLAVSMLSGALGTLGVPVSAEFGGVRVDTVMAQAFGDGSVMPAAPLAPFERERLVTVRRKINGLPVLGSMARMSVSNFGLAARLLVEWPQFRLPTGLVLRPRQQVIDDIAQRIMNSEWGAEVDLRIHLAYAPVGRWFVPVALVRFADPLSGEEQIVPLVAMNPDSDMDGTPDERDNCPDDRNYQQFDADQDGVGDVCDNCPGRYNPDQRDINADGVGDACQCSEPPQDADFDGDIDLNDFSAFQACFNGPNRPYATAGVPRTCACLDDDQDGDVDLNDFSVFQACFNGPNRPASCRAD